MKKKERISKPITKKSTSTKKQMEGDEVWSEYLNIYSLQMAPSNRDHRKRVCLSMMKWAIEHPKAIKIPQFLQMEGIGRATWYEWQAVDPFVASTHKNVLMILGNKREQILVDELKNAASIMHMMPHYDPDWKARESEKAELTKKVEGVSGETLVVEIPMFGTKKE